MKYLVMIILFALLSSGAAFDLPASVKKSMKKHCEGEVVGMEKERVKDFTVYAITTKEGKERVNYFFSESGRLIHHAEERRHDDDHEEDKERDGDRDEEREKDGDRNRDNDKEDRFDRFEDEKEMSEKERREHDEREDHEDEDDEDGPETYEDLDKDDIPEVLKKSLKKHLGDKEYHVGRELIYIVETEYEGREMSLIFNYKGELIEKEFHDEEDEDGEDDEEGEEQEDGDEEDEDE